MDWIKRNLYFLIGAVVALALMGMAGWFLYSKWKLNTEMSEKLNTTYEELKGLNNQNPHPGYAQVDNIKTAKEQQQQVLEVIRKARGHFQPIPPIPDLPKISDYDFSAAVRRTIDQLQHEATNASVNLPAAYKFSFEAQWQRLTFAAGSLERLALQLGEVKAICDILHQAKINSLDNLRRERVCADDQQGPATDYLDQKSVTNQLAILNPYEVSFRCFSTELAAVLSGFASSPHGFVVKAINVEQAPASSVTEQPAVSPIIIQQPVSDQQQVEDSRAAMMRRYGLGGRGRYGPSPTIPQPEPTYTPPVGVVAATPGAKGGLTTVLDEKQLKVTLTLTVVKPVVKSPDGK